MGYPLTALRGGNDEDHDEHDREGLDRHPPAHHPISVFFVEFAALGHGNQAKDKHADNGDHRDQEKDKECVHAHDHIARSCM